MKHKLTIISLTVLSVLFLDLGIATAQEPEPGLDIGAQATVDTSFTYQGRLTDGGSPATGQYDFRFRLYNAGSGGSQVGVTNTLDDVTVTEGLFTAELDFGAVFGGTAYWLDIGVRPGSSSDSYTTLSPRQPLTPAPYAHSLRPGADIAGAIDAGGILNVMNLHENGDGLRVDLVGDDGVHVVVARGDGLYVNTADENGLRVDSADLYGVYLDSTGYDGVYVSSAGHAGLHVGSTGDDGVYVDSAGNPSTTVPSTGSNGFQVAGAENHGLYIGRADDDGVRVHSTGYDGVYVYSAGDDGMYVRSAGSPSTRNPSTDSNGFEVAGTENHGLYVGQADDDGVHVHSAGESGVYVASAGNGLEVNSVVNDGVYVDSAGYFGMYVGSTGDDGVVVDSAGHDGLVVYSASDDGIHVYSADDNAGVFQGNVWISGHLTKGSLSFKIDHPLDPENQYLYHSGVESPDMMNIYNGNVTLDDNGEAWITMPDWFEALNRDFRYQLTPLGGPGPNLYIAQEIRDNRFQIAGGAPGMKVSWQVTGIRHDPYAEASRIPVEEEKPAEERGVYLHPDAYGQPETMGLAYREARAHQANQPAAGR
jgi:hypothetical protein